MNKNKKTRFIASKKELDKMHNELSDELGINKKDRLIGGYVTKRMIDSFNQNNCFK